MNGDQITLRLPRALKTKIRIDAAERGITRTSWIVHLIERGQITESLERFLSKMEQPAAVTASSAGSSNVPEKIIERVLFATCFAEALMIKLNASLNRSSSEMGINAQQARDQAEAETAMLLKALRG